MPTLARARKMLARNRPIPATVYWTSTPPSRSNRWRWRLLIIAPAICSRSFPSRSGQFSRRIRCPRTRRTGYCRAFRWTSDAPRLMASRRTPASSIVPPRPSSAGLGRRRPRGMRRPGSKRDSFSSPVPVEVKVCGGARNPCEDSLERRERPRAPSPRRPAPNTRCRPSRVLLRAAGRSCHPMDRDGRLRARPGPGRGRSRRAGAAPANGRRLDDVAPDRRGGGGRRPGGLGVLRARPTGSLAPGLPHPPSGDRSRRPPTR